MFSPTETCEHPRVVRRSPRNPAHVAALALASACGPVVGSADSSTDGPWQPNDTSATAPTTSVSASDTSADVSVGDAEVDVDSGLDDALLPDFWEPIPECPSRYDATPIPSQVWFLVDVSQTMTTRLLDHDLDADTPDVTRWSMVANNLAEWLPMFTTQSTMGMVAFPSVEAESPPSPTACDVTPQHPAFGATADEMLAYLPAPDAAGFAGATPTGRAYELATLDISSVPSAPPTHVVLVTDGAPNCSEATTPPALFDEVDAGLLADVESLHDDGIPTHVVAIDVPSGPSGGGVEGDAIADHHATLAALAEAGGTTIHDAADANTLDLAMSAVLGATQSCRLSVPPELAGWPFQIEIGDDRVYYEVPPELCADNWGYVFVGGTDEAVIEMCSGACESLRAVGSASFVEICVIAE